MLENLWFFNVGKILSSILREDAVVDFGVASIFFIVS